MKLLNAFYKREELHQIFCTVLTYIRENYETNNFLLFLVGYLYIGRKKYILEHVPVQCFSVKELKHVHVHS